MSRRRIDVGTSRITRHPPRSPPANKFRGGIGGVLGCGVNLRGDGVISEIGDVCRSVVKMGGGATDDDLGGDVRFFLDDAGRGLRPAKPMAGFSCLNIASLLIEKCSSIFVFVNHPNSPPNEFSLPKKLKSEI